MFHSWVSRTLVRKAATLSVAALIGGAHAGTPNGGATVVDGLLGPRGIDVDAFGRIVVGETSSRPWNPGDRKFTAFVSTHGDVKEKTLWDLPDPQPGASEEHPELWGADPADVVSYGPFATFALLGGEGPEELAGKLFYLGPHGSPQEMADIGAYQQTDPDPWNQDTNPDTESNPNGLAVLPGFFLVADAANNDLLLVNMFGGIETVARFMPLPFPAGLTESVPTAVAVGPDGHWYVSTLPGFPAGAAPGMANIYRINPGARDAVCDPALASSDCQVYAAGFSAVNDIAFTLDGRLLVLEMSTNGTLGIFDVANPSGALWSVASDGTRTLLAEQLPAPGGVAVRGFTAYVTTGAFPGVPNGTVTRLDVSP